MTQKQTIAELAKIELAKMREESPDVDRVLAIRRRLKTMPAPKTPKTAYKVKGLKKEYYSLLTSNDFIKKAVILKRLISA